MSITLRALPEYYSHLLLEAPAVRTTADGSSRQAVARPRACARYAPSVPDLHPLDVIALLPVEQVVRVDAGVFRLLRHCHRDRLPAGANAVLLPVEQLALDLALLPRGEDPDL